MPELPQSPIIITNGGKFSPSSVSPSGLFSKIPENVRKWLIRGIFAVLGIAIAVELYLGLKQLTAPIPRPPKLAQMSDGAVLLTAEKSQYKVGETATVSITVGTGGWTTDGADIIVKYDPAIFDATQSTSSQSFVKGKIYEEYPSINIDPQKGIIAASGISSLSKKPYGFNGVGIFGTLNLVAKAVGKSTISVEYRAGATDESNIMETSQAKDILGKVTNIELAVQ